MNTVCKNCQKKITIQIFIGEDYCSVNCKKALGIDPPSTGTMVRLSPKEQAHIERRRAYPGATSMLVSVEEVIHG